MRNLIRLAIWIFLLLVFFASIGFSFLNTTPVPLSLGFWTFAPQPLAVWVVAGFATGGFFGLLTGMGLIRVMKTRLEIRNLRKQLDAANQELDQQRGSLIREMQ